MLIVARVFILSVPVLALAWGVWLVFDIVTFNRELKRRRAEYERWKRLLGPTMERWEAEFRAEGIEVPPPTRRMQ